MESTNNNNNQLLSLSEFKELRNELSAMKKRIVQLEKSHEKQQEKIDVLERENHALKTQLNLDGMKAVGSVLKRKGTDHKEEPESKPASSTSVGKKKKTNNNNNNNDDDDEAVVIPRRDNGDSFDSLSDDLLHKIVEFDGNCYSKFGLINKRCKNIYDVKEYKLEKETCVFGYGTVDMMLEQYLKKRRDGTLGYRVRLYISTAVIIYNRLDAIDWIIQLGDTELFPMVCYRAALYGKINILSKAFLKFNLAMLDKLLDDNATLCYNAASNGQLQTLKWLRKYGAEWDVYTYYAAKDEGYDDIVQYLRAEGCPDDEDEDESEEQFAIWL